MAGNDSSKKRKRLTMEDVNISAPVYDPPQQFSMSGLYDPTMVTIDVVDESDPGWKQKFNVPLDLLTTKSPYFKGLFESGFEDSQEGYVKLRDVSPFVFRVFVGWLYTQGIFYEVENKKRRIFRPRPASKPQKSTIRNKSACNTKQASSTSSSGLHTTGKESSAIASNPYTDDPSMIIADSKEDSPEKLEFTNLPLVQHWTSSRHHPPGGNDNKYHQKSEPAFNESNSKDECDYREPQTWPWMWLFQTYVFSDEYDVRGFRIKLFEVIQMKLLREEPRTYRRPSTAEFIYVVDNLPPSSPLYRFLDSWAIWLTFPIKDESAKRVIEELELMPVQFLSRCLFKSKRHARAMACYTWRPGGVGGECEENTHSKEDVHGPDLQNVCFYHEHGEDNEEKARCILRWESLVPELQGD